MTKGPYDDIIDLPHHVSSRHPQLGRDSYAAQFSPFAALTGYEGIVEETARFTNEKGELTEEAKLRLSDRLALALERQEERPELTVTYYLPDIRKSGGEYRTVTGTVKQYDDLHRILYLSDGTAIPMEDVFDIQGDLFREVFE